MFGHFRNCCRSAGRSNHAVRRSELSPLAAIFEPGGAATSATPRQPAGLSLPSWASVFAAKAFISASPHPEIGAATKITSSGISDTQQNRENEARAGARFEGVAPRFGIQHALAALRSIPAAGPAVPPVHATSLGRVLGVARVAAVCVWIVVFSCHLGRRKATSGFFRGQRLRQST